ncbi:MAG: acyltransferase [Bacteroidota bacterium]
MTKVANRNNWLDYLRSFITILVVAHHSSLAYTTFAHFNKEAYILSTHPVVDTIRWRGLDIFEDFNDVFFMSLMFLISGIFIIPSLESKGIMRFVRDRFRRLFIPFMVGVTVLMLVAYYPAWYLAHGRAGGSETSGGHGLAGLNGLFEWTRLQGWSGMRAYVVDFFTVESWPVGPPWFIWVLFLFNLIVAGGYSFLKPWLDKWSAWVSSQQQYPGRIFLGWLLLTWVAYIPFVLRAGPDAWTGLGPFDFQLSRLVLYFCYFLLGVLFGGSGLTKGILSEESMLVKTGSFWLVGCLCAYAELKYSETPLTKWVNLHELSSLQATLIYRSMWVLSCTLSCMAFLTTFKEWVKRKNTRWESLSANAYGIYLTHYIFVVWCQYWLLGTNLPALVKFIITFVLSLALSWSLTSLIRRNALIKKYL